MKVFLLRHGMTAGNAERRYIGRTDESLCPYGIADAREFGADHGVKQVYVSPLMRARQTAVLLFPDARPIVVPDFREMDFGDFEGRTADEMEADAAYCAWVEGGCTGPCPGGESRSAFENRTCLAFEKIILEESARGAENVVILAHGGTVMSVMGRYANPPQDYFAWFVKNCRGYAAEVAMDAAGQSALSDDVDERSIRNNARGLSLRNVQYLEKNPLNENGYIRFK